MYFGGAGAELARSFRVIYLTYNLTFGADMAHPKIASTRLSTKGQLILPKAIRDRHGWSAGVELVVEDRADGVYLRARTEEPMSRYDEVRGSLGPVARRHTIEDMNQAVLDEARRRWERKSGAGD